MNTLKLILDGIALTLWGYIFVMGFIALAGKVVN